MTLNDSVYIRPERKTDFEAVRRVVAEAFAGAEHTDGDEHNLVERLRASGDCIPGLSLVAEYRGEIIGCAVFSRISIGNGTGVALAPLAVLPEFQNSGIGRALVRTAHAKAREAGYSCSVVLGSPGYYGGLGYLPAESMGIIAPFDVPPEFYMVCPLNTPVPKGSVVYSKAFGL